jgi:hypothetical protein
MRCHRREKVFGPGRAVPLDRNAKARIAAYARAWSARNRQPRQHRGPITRAFLDVLQALLWGFHNAASGLCFPSYEAIAEKAGCARSTVAEAVKALEKAGLLTWVNRIKRVHERVINLFGEGVHGQRSRIFRTSNGYQFIEPPDVQSSKSENKSGTAGQESFPSLATLVPALKPVDSGLEAALLRLESAIRTGASRA